MSGGTGKAGAIHCSGRTDINEQEAEIVRLIFDKYVYEGYGAQRIATYLNNAGYRARSGKCWHPGSLRGMVGNLTYMGVLRCGDARSELMPELQIIPQEEFEAAQRIREDRSAHAAEEAEHHVPLRTRGQALLSNNVYCGHCGARLALTTSRKWRKLSDGTLDDIATPATENSASRRIAPGRPATLCTFWMRSSTRWFARFSPA